MAGDNIQATIGIDIGKGGALCLLPATIPPELEPMPIITPASGKGKRRYDVAALVRILSDWRDRYWVRLVAIEKQQSFPGQGVSSTFSIGEGYGLVCGVVAALGMPWDSPIPRVWQKDMHSGIPGADSKARSIEACGRLFPGVDLRRTERCRVKDDGKADALMIAEWARRKVGGA